MKMLAFAIRDSKAEYFQEPIFARTRAEAIRSLEMELRSEKSRFRQCANDFALFELGSWDALTGKLEVHQQPVHVINAFEVVPQAPKGLEVVS